VTGSGLLMANGGGLAVRIPAVDWMIELRRADFRPDPLFARFHGASVGGREVALFLPNWRALRWERIPHHDLARSECCALDGKFLVNLKADLDSRKTHDDVIAAFVRFMEPLAP